eukprot:SAG11_NODE_1293_length_5284_cov_2.541562_6_plen_96_part_00
MPGLPDAFGITVEQLIAGSWDWSDMHVDVLLVIGVVAAVVYFVLIASRITQETRKCSHVGFVQIDGKTEKSPLHKLMVSPNHRDGKIVVPRHPPL